MLTRNFNIPLALVISTTSCTSIAAEKTYWPTPGELIITKNRESNAINQKKSDIKISVPNGWTTLSSTHSHIVKLANPGNDLEITVVAHYHDKIKQKDIQDYAKYFSENQLRDISLAAIDQKTHVTYTDNRVLKDNVGWQSRNSAGLHNGHNLRSMTFFEPGRSISIEAESSKVGPLELDSAITQIVAAAGFSSRATSHYKSCRTTAEYSAFQSAIEKFRLYKFNDAIFEFSEYISNYPNSPIINNIYFFKGGAQYALREYDAAQSSFTNVVSDSPNTFAQEALLMIAAIQNETGNRSLARANYQRLIDQFADSDAAAQARKQLNLPPVAATSRPIYNYPQQVRDLVYSNIKYSGTHSAVVEVKVTLQCDGKITAVNILKSSDTPEWDVAVIEGITNVEVFPFDTDGTVPPYVIMSIRSK